MRRKGLATAAVLALVCVGCGQLTRHAAGPRQTTASASASSAVPVFRAHPQAIEPVAGAAAQPAEPDSQPQQQPPEVSVENSGSGGSLPQPVPDSVVRRELAASGVASKANRATLTPSGLAIPPANAPPVVQTMIEAGNQIAHLPYRYGGGHGTFQDTAYDCSGSISFVFGAVGMLGSTVDSSQLMAMGDPGPGQWVTIYANPGHTFMYVAGLRFDTVALAETGSRWSNRPADEPDLASFAVRHPPGM